MQIDMKKNTSNIFYSFFQGFTYTRLYIYTSNIRRLHTLTLRHLPLLRIL